ncbi:hypothetical protein BD289DRAFT_461227 [Coniella lustricola]|uniref:Uncharacterized protein n=1 Tax=Coniella lustricola TaxID=2025994 RepID=A0A2T3A6F1_9PEZI|nr:hypothetical protein BD289DRAFT_461227 [Coniella lustricola]
MDPDCAICHAPATLKCECEAKSLETAIRQAEARMMQNICNDIRTWVREHAQDSILRYFGALSDARKAAHAAHINRITQHAAIYFSAPPHPSEIEDAQRELKRAIDEDWQVSVQRYPEVLQYYYGLVDFTVPDEDAPSIQSPPLLAGMRQPLPKRRMGGVDTSAATIASSRNYHMERIPSSFAPPRLESRTPGPSEMDRRRSFSRLPPHPANYYPHGPYQY